MITLNSLLHWHLVAALAWDQVLKVDDDVVEDAAALDRQMAPDWLQELVIHQDWQLIQLADQPSVPLVRVTVRGDGRDGEWAGADTVSAFSYTRKPALSDVNGIGNTSLRELGVRDAITKALPVPPREGIAAARSTGIALTDGRRIWVQQTTFVVGSREQHAGRLVLHNVFVDGERRTKLGGDVAELSDAMYRGFIASLG